MSDIPTLGARDWKALEGCLLMVKPLQHLPDINAVQADIHIIDGKKAGTVLRAVHVIPPMLQDQIRSNAELGLLNLGRLGRGAPAGRGNPWKLLEQTAFDRHLALRYLESEPI